MSKFKYVAEYEVKAALKMLFPYLSTASGLQEWFADEVNILPNRNLDFIWEGESHIAQVASKRTNHHIKFQFLPENEEDDHNLSTLEFKIDFNEMTQSSFLTVTDYSEMDDLEELHELWDQLIDDLKEILGSRGF